MHNCSRPSRQYSQRPHACDGLTATFAEAGVAEPRALAIEMLCALEGAFVFCRALRSTEALDVAGRAVAERVRAALR